MNDQPMLVNHMEETLRLKYQTTIIYNNIYLLYMILISHNITIMCTYLQQNTIHSILLLITVLHAMFLQNRVRGSTFKMSFDHNTIYSSISKCNNKRSNNLLLQEYRGRFQQVVDRTTRPSFCYIYVQCRRVFGSALKARIDLSSEHYHSVASSDSDKSPDIPPSSPIAYGLMPLQSSWDTIGSTLPLQRHSLIFL